MQRELSSPVRAISDEMTPMAESRETDAALISKSLDDAEAFALLYDRHAAAIHRFVARRLGEHAADDLVAETFLAAFRRRHLYQLDRLDARPWLYGIVTRLIGRHRRAEVRMWRAIARSGIDPGTADELGRAENRLAARSHRRSLAAALAKLSVRDRHALLLVAWADLSYEEVAVALGIPVGTVRSRLNRARRQLREELQQLEPSSTIQELCHERA